MIAVHPGAEQRDYAPEPTELTVYPRGDGETKYAISQVAVSVSETKKAG